MKNLFIIFLFTSSILFCDIIGRGIGETEVLAKKSALDELSQQIEVNVDSIFYSEETKSNDDYNKNSTGIINLYSNNFLLGVEYKIEKVGKNYSALAIISNDKSFLYEQKVNDTYNLVSSYFEKANNTKSPGEKKSYLLGSLKELQKGNNYKNIAILLGSKKTKTSLINEADIQDALQKLKNSSLDKIILYVSLEDTFVNIKNLVTKNLVQISKDNSLDLLIGDNNYNNTTLIVKVSSLTQEEIPAFYYNKKKLSDKIFKTSLSLTFILKDSFSGSIYDTVTLESSSKSFASSNDSLNIATNSILRDGKDKLSIMLQNLY